jgi:hypothetical protein
MQPRPDSTRRSFRRLLPDARGRGSTPYAERRAGRRVALGRARLHSDGLLASAETRARGQYHFDASRRDLERQRADLADVSGELLVVAQMERWVHPLKNVESREPR